MKQCSTFTRRQACFFTSSVSSDDAVSGEILGPIHPTKLPDGARTRPQSKDAPYSDVGCVEDLQRSAQEGSNPDRGSSGDDVEVPCHYRREIISIFYSVPGCRKSFSEKRRTEPLQLLLLYLGFSEGRPFLAFCCPRVSKRVRVRFECCTLLTF